MANISKFKIGFILLAVCIFAAIMFNKMNFAQDQKQVQQTTELFFNALSQGDLKTAAQLSWQKQQLKITPEMAQHYKDMQLLEIMQISKDSAQHRPEYYQQFYKMMSVMLKIKSAYESEEGDPPGEYILFVTLTQASPESDWLVTEIGSGP
ncbi:hypothetical protein EC844_12436 [Acinetobacter calcoaceticus]|uniref:DUF4829 domain-containing protein n=1 Tax=Acinetobacter calcoaceticus TaxID=471 RepID=A0A4V2R001_ACICA|nr:hypothetical protein EC844_12436 [Acinetobacter calcoaceticus]